MKGSILTFVSLRVGQLLRNKGRVAGESTSLNQTWKTHIPIMESSAPRDVTSTSPFSHRTRNLSLSFQHAPVQTLQLGRVTADKTNDMHHDHKDTHKLTEPSLLHLCLRYSSQVQSPQTFSWERLPIIVT